MKCDEEFGNQEIFCQQERGHEGEHSAQVSWDIEVHQ